MCMCVCVFFSMILEYNNGLEMTSERPSYTKMLYSLYRYNPYISSATMDVKLA